MKILVIGNYGSTNLGDELILHGMINFLKNKYSSHKNISFLAFSHSPLFSQNFGQFKQTQIKFTFPLPFGIRSFIKSFFSSQLLTTLKFYWQTDLVVLGWGGLFQDQETSAPYLWLSRLLPAILFRKKIISIGTSLWPLNKTISRKIAKFCYKQCSEIIVRDHFSQQLLQGMSIPVPNISLNLDMVNFLKIPYIGERSPSNILINLRHCPHNDPQLVDKMSTIIENCTKYYQQVLLVSFESNRSNDYSLLKEIYLALPTNIKKQTQLIDPQTLITKDDILKLYQQISTVFSMRLHPLIIGTLTNKVLIPLSYSPKVENYIKENDLAHNIFYNDNLDTIKIIKALNIQNK